MAITILDVLYARNPSLKEQDGISMAEFNDHNLPFFSGCQCCQASLGPSNAYPSRSGYIRCKGCIDNYGFDTVDVFDLLCFCEDWDLRIRSDVMEAEGTERYTIYSLSTFEDRSVGIFGEVLTPWFKTEQELWSYVKKNQGNIERRLNVVDDVYVNE